MERLRPEIERAAAILGDQRRRLRFYLSLHGMKMNPEEDFGQFLGMMLNPAVQMPSEDDVPARDLFEDIRSWAIQTRRELEPILAERFFERIDALAKPLYAKPKAAWTRNDCRLVALSSEFLFFTLLGNFREGEKLSGCLFVEPETTLKQKSSKVKRSVSGLRVQCDGESLLVEDRHKPLQEAIRLFEREGIRTPDRALTELELRKRLGNIGLTTIFKRWGAKLNAQEGKHTAHPVFDKNFILEDKRNKTHRFYLNKSAIIL